MGITKRTPLDALKAASKAEATATDLEAKAAETSTTARKMDAEATDALVANPAQADKITAGITAQERLAAAYTRKAAEARAAVDEHYREALELEAADLDRQADRLDRDADKITERVTAALKALEDVDGYAWERKPTRKDSLTGQPIEWSIDGAAGDKRGEAETIRYAAKHTRYFLKHGTKAPFLWNIDQDNPNTQASGPLGATTQPEHTTQALAAYAAGQTLTADHFTTEA